MDHPRTLSITVFPIRERNNYSNIQNADFFQR